MLNKLQFRQGDILIDECLNFHKIQTEKTSEDDVRHGALILAYGESTGHKHAVPVQQIKGIKNAVLLKGVDNEKRYLVVNEDSANALLPLMKIKHKAANKFITPSTWIGTALVHEEHSKIPLPKAPYQVIKQREYNPERSREVID